MFKRTHYDAIIVGSGATGGWAAKTLPKRDARLVLEAGGPGAGMQTQRLFERVRNKTGYLIENDHRAVSRQCIQAQCYAWRHDPHAFVDDADNPYTRRKRSRSPDSRASSGGRRWCVVTGCTSIDSRTTTSSGECDGFGVDWPIDYSDLEPFYDRVERFIGLVGNADNIASYPTRSGRAYRDHIRESISRLSSPSVGRIESSLRGAPLRRRCLSWRRTPPVAQLRAERGARDPGRRGHWARARRLVARTRAGAVRLRAGRRSRGVHHRVCATALELVQPPASGGLGNSSGTVGCYLMDHTHIFGFESTMPLPASKLKADESWSYVRSFAT